MTTSIRVWEGGGAREARRETSASGCELLALLGIDERGAAPRAHVPLGDALVAIGAALALAPTRAVLASASVLEVADDQHRVGAVVAAGEVAGLASFVRRDDELLIVADASDPDRSMAEQLRRARPDDPPSAVMGVMSLGEACERLLDLPSRAARGELVRSDRRESVRGSLFAKTLRESRVALDWSTVAAIATGLSRHLAPEDDRGRFELGLVRAVSRRHCGLTALLPWPTDEELAPYDEDERLMLASHVVQSASDGDMTAIPAYAARAAALDGVDTRLEGLKLQGAVGRARAAIGDFEGASALLRATLSRWLERDPAQASYALCELLRVEGVLGRGGSVAALRDREVRAQLSAADSTTRAYVSLALGRALAQTGDPRGGLELLEGELFDGDVPQHVKDAALRWRAVAARALGDVQRAREAVERLELGDESDQRWLARLDAVVADAGAGADGAQACLDGLLAVAGGGDEARRMLGRLAPGLSTRAASERPEIVRRLLGEYRY